MPPQTKIVPPPKRGLCTKEINRLGATGVQIEALGSQNSTYRHRIREQEPFFRNFCGLIPDFMKLRVYVGTKTFLFVFFFWSSPFSFHPHSRIHINKVLVPPQNSFILFQSRYPGAGSALKIASYAFSKEVLHQVVTDAPSNYCK